jgi:predicted metal-dependent phosphoesterase TrpH
MGVAALHLHSTHSDGRCAVAETLDLLDATGGVDVVSFTDHDEIGAWEDAVTWKAAHPLSSITPLWGCEVTVGRSAHVLAYIFQPPYPSRRFPARRPFRTALGRIAEAGGVCIIAHPDQWVVGIGLRRLERDLAQAPVLGLETHSPYVRSSERLAAFAAAHHLAAIGGSDAHFPQHLLKWTTEFPGDTPADLLRALEARTTVPREGPPADRVPIRELALQQVQALVVLPGRKAARVLRLGGAAR